MSAQLAGYGRLGAAPKSIDTKTGTKMAVGSMAVTLHDRHGEEHTQWVGLVAFGRVAEALLRHKKGELVSASGRVQANVYNERVELQIICDAVISARSVRPGGGGKKKPNDGGNGGSAREPGSDDEPRDFDDPIPF